MDGAQWGICRTQIYISELTRGGIHEHVHVYANAVYISIVIGISSCGWWCNPQGSREFYEILRQHTLRGRRRKSSKEVQKLAPSTPV